MSFRFSSKLLKSNSVNLLFFSANIAVLLILVLTNSQALAKVGSPTLAKAS